MAILFSITTNLSKPMSVPVDCFVSNMKNHWQSSLKNTSSPELENIWSKICETFNHKVENEFSPIWHVLQPPTGSGKTQGLVIYCSMLPEIIGALIVVRFKEQADMIASSINQIAGIEKAVSRHSDHLIPMEDLRDTQVLVITHKAYENSLDRFQHDLDWSLKNYITYKKSKRRLIVIDEALDLVRSSQVKLEDLNYVLGVIPQDVKDKHPYAILAFETAKQTLEKIHEISKKSTVPDRDKILSGGSHQKPFSELNDLRGDLRNYRWDKILNESHDDHENTRIRERLDRIIHDLTELFLNWNYFSKKGKFNTLNTASLIIPDGIEGAVVMDATAKQNLLWDLLSDKSVRIRTPKGARSYSNVDLYVSRTTQLGKQSMNLNGQSRSIQLFKELKRRISTDSQVLLVCHKDSEHWYSSQEHDFRNFEVTHWGAIDGKNDWQDFDTVVIAGIPYRDRVWANNTFMAIRGLQSNEWLQNSTKRAFGTIEDIQRGLQLSQITVSILQAINRIRCRRVIDEYGNCKSSKIYLLIPHGEEGEEVLNGICTEMPLMQLHEWKFKWNDINSSDDRTNFKEVITRLMENAHSGKYTYSWFQERIFISRRQWSRIVKDIRDEHSLFAKKMMDAGVSYVSKGKGRGAKSYFEKLT